MSGMTLKWIALVLMFLDHLGEFFPLVIPVGFRWLGRLSAPLFLFCLAQGMDRKDAMQYAAMASSIAVTRPGAAASIPEMPEVRAAVQALRA